MTATRGGGGGDPGPSLPWSRAAQPTRRGRRGARVILSPGVRFLSCSTSGQGHQPERTLSVASPGATVQWLRPRRKFSQNLVVKNKPFVVLKDAVSQNSDRALCGQLVSASCCLESHLEKSKAGGRSPLKASSSACWGVDGGCWLGPQCLSVSASVWLTLGFLKA